MAEISASFQIHGFKELDAIMRSLPVEVAGPITLAGLRAGGEVIRRAAVRNIDSRTGRTAADIRVEIQISGADREGVAAVGGTAGKGGRGFVLRFLEFGTGRHPIRPRLFDVRKKVAKFVKRRDFPRAIATAEAGRKAKGGLAFNGIVRTLVKHKGIRPEAPLTRALAENIERVIKALKDTLRSGIHAAIRSHRRAA